jgi:hypothetical protein
LEEDRLGHQGRWEYLRAIYERYQKAERKGKKVILSEFCANTGYNRKNAIRLLNRPRPEQRKRRIYGRTKPGYLLKHHIPVKTDRWDVQSPGFTEVDLVSHSGNSASGEFAHTLNVTDIHTTWTEWQRIDRGLAQRVVALNLFLQDFAHLLLGVVRKRGLPAQYVSGYLVPESAASPDAKLQEVISGSAPHAWAEVYLPDSGWIGLDPTLGKPLGLQHVRIAYGRDYGNVAPIRGVYKRHAGQRHSVDVSVRPAIDEDGREQLDEN